MKKIDSLLVSLKKSLLLRVIASVSHVVASVSKAIRKNVCVVKSLNGYVTNTFCHDEEENSSQRFILLIMTKWRCKVLLLILLAILPGCKMAEKLAQIDEPPGLSQIQDPTLVSNYRPISMPMPEPLEPNQGMGNSLWQTGSKAFFKDQRACKVGDILTVLITLDQKQEIEMTPSLSQTSTLNSSITNLYGLQKKFKPSIGLPNILGATSSPSLTGSGKYTVNDKMSITMAANIIQILPNGSMVIDGRQEIGLVNEVREIYLSGIVRREDISAANTITMPKIAQLRIGYRGRGDLTDNMTEPLAHRIIHKVSPF